MSERICHVHVGMPKTGSSAIQSVFARNPDPRLFYLPVKNVNHSTMFQICFESRPEMSRANYLMGLTREEAIARRRASRRKLDRQLDAALQDPNITGILSSGERMSNAGKANETAHGRFKAFFEKWADRFRVYGYARPLQSLLPSDFQQRIQVGKGLSLDLDFYYPNYRQKFEKFENVYGREAVSLRLFSREALVDGDVTADLADQIGVTLNRKLKQDKNLSLCLEATAIIFTFGMSGRVRDTDTEAAEWNRKLALYLKGLKGQKMAFCPEGIARVAERNADDLKWIESRVGASLYEGVPPRGVVIRTAADLYEIAAEVVRSGCLNELPAVADVPTPDMINRWLLEDLDRLATQRVRAAS